MTNSQYTKKTNPKTNSGSPLYVMAVGGSGAGQAVNPDGSTNVQLTGSNVVQLKLSDSGVSLYSANGTQDSSSALGISANGMYVFNGSTWDRVRNNMQGTLLASAARTATTNTSNQTNYNAKGIMLFLNITVASGTGGVKPRIFPIDPVSGVSGNQLNADPAFITANGLYVFELYPGVSSGGGLQQVQSGVLPRNFLVSIVHGDSTSYTYSLGYALIN